jgi:hypothetical protein
MSNNKNKLPIPNSKGYTVDVDTHMVYNSLGRHMRPHVDKRKRVCTKIMLIDGSQRTIIIKDTVRNILKQDANPVEKQQVSLEKDLKIDFLIRQIATYHEILKHMEQLQMLTNFEERQDYLIKLGKGLDMDLATTALQMVVTDNGWLNK